MVNIEKVIFDKIDLYITSYIKANFNLNKIHWVFSISGGKDSFTMAKAIKNWYEINGYNFKSTGLFINQWDSIVKDNIKQKFDWLDEIHIIDAYHKTSTLKDSITLQAPCRQCSDIRHQLSDEFLKKYNNEGMVNFLCRGLHLSDMAVSLLWRFVWGFDPYEHLAINQKGKPISYLFDNNYLLKPLCFVREYESQLFAQKNKYTPSHCKCPALKYPSRRDIIEESALTFYNSPLWEFEIWGMDTYIKETLQSDSKEIENLSVEGKETKKNILPEKFFDYTLSQFKLQERSIQIHSYYSFDYTLDEIGINYLQSGIKKDLCGGSMSIC